MLESCSISSAYFTLKYIKNTNVEVVFLKLEIFLIIKKYIKLLLELFECVINIKYM